MKNVYAANIYVSYSYKTKFLLWEKGHRGSFSFQENGDLAFSEEKDAENEFRNLPYIQRLINNDIPKYFYVVHDLPLDVHIDSVKIVSAIFATSLEYLKSHMAAEKFLEYCVETQKKFLNY